MNEKAKEALAIYVKGLFRFENRTRRGLAILEKRIKEDLEDGLRRIEEAKKTKKRVPLYTPQHNLPIDLDEEPESPNVLEEEPVKKIRRLRKRKDKNSASENNIDIKMSTKNKSRKRPSNDNLAKEEPVLKRRGMSKSSKANQQDVPIKNLSTKNTFSGKKTILSVIDNVLEEREDKNSFSIELVNNNGTIVNPIPSTSKPLNFQVLEGEKPLIDIATRSKSKNPNSFLISDETNHKSEDVGLSRTFVKRKKTDKAILDQEKTLTLINSKNNSNFEGENHNGKHAEVTRIEMKSVTNVSKEVSCSTALSSSNQVNAVVKKDETLKNTIILSSDVEEQKNVLKNETGTNDFVVPLLPSIVLENTTLPQSSSNENLPVEKRFTRSKSKAIKEKEKVCPPSSSESGEESDAKREFTSFSDSELEKKKVKDVVKMFNEKQAMVLLSSVPIRKEQEKENHKCVGLMKKDKITPIMGRRIIKTTPLQVRNGYITPNKKPTPVISRSSKNKSLLDVVEKRKKEEEARLKRLKEEEVLRKKQEMLKIKQDELKRKHEEKKLKAAAMREAAEKEKTEVILKLEKEREEREKLAKAEIERKKMEEAIKKKLANQTKAAEVEHRRLREEAARAEKLKEMEEEQRQQEELRQKQLEENERIIKARQEDQRAKEISKKKLLYQKEMQKKNKATVLTLKDKDNYSITGDLLVDEELDDMEEENSKKEIPTWAKREERLLPSKIQVHYPNSLVTDFFCCPSSTPDLTDMFGKMTMKRIRSSSAVWLDSPPLK